MNTKLIFILHQYKFKAMAANLQLNIKKIIEIEDMSSPNIYFFLPRAASLQLQKLDEDLPCSDMVSSGNSVVVMNNGYRY
jgi:hypothetical protein